MFGFFNVDGFEMIVVMIIALLLFGERLPEVARKAAKTFLELRKSLEDLRSKTGIDEELRKIKREVDLPSASSLNPRRFIQDTMRSVAEEMRQEPSDSASHNANGANGATEATPGALVEDAQRRPEAETGEQPATAVAPSPEIPPDAVRLPPPDALSPFERAAQEQRQQQGGAEAAPT